MPRQYVTCRFRPKDQRTYTYHNEGDPVAVGDVVQVDDWKGGGGWKRVDVVSITDSAPTFPTKPILGKLENDTQE
jgi:hypothetical protein